MNNPWIGLSSYTEESLTEYTFYGRRNAIEIFASMIKHNLFVTLYGRSGIGKTSLLQAGIFPLLRSQGMIPVSVRFNGIDDGGTACAERLWKLLTAALDSCGYEYVPWDDADCYIPDFSDVLVLRNLFSAGRFTGPGREEVSPVMVFDQFEEVLYNAPVSADLFVAQLYALIDDNYNLRYSHPSWKDETNFRIVVSIREDDLFLFEDCIDRLNCADLKANRYRLMPLSESEAKEVILGPGAVLFEKGQEDMIAEGIIEISRANGRNINTLMLSLTCHVLYNQKGVRQKVVTYSDLSEYRNIIETYYLETVKSLPKKQRYYLEDHLVDDHGRRTALYLADIETNAPQAKEFMATDSRRLLNLNQGRVELIHDQLAAVVADIRKSRKSEKTKRIGITVLLALLLLVFAYSFSQYRMKYTSLPDVSSVYSPYIVNNVFTVDYTIHNDDGHSGNYIIDDCPNLKKIDIEKYYAQVYIFNCPSLTEVEYPDGFAGQIMVYNCPNLDQGAPAFSEVSLSDYEDYQKVNDNRKKIRDEVDVVLYDSGANTLEIIDYPVFKVRYDKNGEKHAVDFKRYIWLPDSLKKITDCRVMRGSKDQFLQLCDFKGYHSIDELPVYRTWKRNFEGMTAYLKSHSLVSAVIVIGVLLVQVLFWVVAYGIYRADCRHSRWGVICRSFLYGVGMSIVAVLAYMAPYWLMYNVILPGYHAAPVVVGLLVCVTCLGIIYKNVFYIAWQHIRERGFVVSMRDMFRNLYRSCVVMCSFMREHGKVFLIIVAVIFTGAVICVLYADGRAQRERLIAKLIQTNDYDKVPALTDALEEKYGSRIYGFFTDSIEAIRRRTENDSVALFTVLTPSEIVELAESQGLDIGKKIRFDCLNTRFSADGTKCAAVLYSNPDSVQIVCIDIMNGGIAVLTDEFKNDNIEMSFAPSGSALVFSVGSRLFRYDLDENRLIEIDNSVELRPNGLAMVSDSVFYMISGRGLYKGVISENGGWNVGKIDSTYRWHRDLTYMSPDRMVCIGDSAWSSRRLLMMDLLTDKVVYMSNDVMDGLKALTSRYAASYSGILDMSGDTLLFADAQVLQYVAWEDSLRVRKTCDDRYMLYDINGNARSVIRRHARDRGVNVHMTNGNYFIEGGDKMIFMYYSPSRDKKRRPLSSRDSMEYGLN